MDVIGVIPARYGSTRFEGKILANIMGKPMIQHVWERAKQATSLDDLIIACDNQLVFEVAKAFGANVVFTAKAHTCGTDRIAEVVNPLDVKVIVNIQADEPLLEPALIDQLVLSILEDKDVYISTLAKRINNFDEFIDKNIVKVVLDKDNFALYFSRSPIPYLSEDIDISRTTIYKHLGLYAYTKEFLFTFKNLAVSGLEKSERLEQLRVLENGFRIKVIETSLETIGVDTQEDLDKVKQILQRKTNGYSS